MAQSNAVSWRITLGAISALFIAGAVLVVVMLSRTPADYYEQGVSYYQQGQYAAAARAFAQDVAHDPGHGLGHYYLGKSFLQLGEREKASGAFKKAYEVSMRGAAPDPAFAAKCYDAAQQAQR